MQLKIETNKGKSFKTETKRHMKIYKIWKNKY